MKQNKNKLQLVLIFSSFKMLMHHTSSVKTLVNKITVERKQRNKD